MSMLKEHSRHLELLGGIISATNTSHNHPPRGTGSVSCGDSNTVRSTSSGALQRSSGAVQRSSMVASSRGGQDQREYREQYQHHGDGVLDDPMNSLVDARRGRGNLSSIHRLHPSSTGDASTMPRYLPSSPARGEDGNLLSRRGSNSRARDESLVFMLDSWRKTSGRLPSPLALPSRRSIDLILVNYSEYQSLPSGFAHIVWCALGFVALLAVELTLSLNFRVALAGHVRHAPQGFGHEHGK